MDKTGMGNGGRTMKILNTVPRIVVGLLLMYASTEKLMNPDAFAVSVANYDLLPAALVGPVALWLPWLEMLTGILLVAGRFTMGAATTAATLMMVFSAAVGISYLRGLDINCGCFSLNPESVADMRLVLLRDLGLLALCVIALTRAVSEQKKAASA